ncbi:V-set and immunoglobulin domain-containing protein 10 isoform X1 [Syngnathoides biaculeatus]|uniref:V-set and immunoglobulin domain-containing protein 10 isoform X1 n=1 Tax=Syngnathoides biaculeatus TaxID=300417 RepID=UPI002ADE8EFF|nr:V-set and immunoglobulin domain-containing protein 10 isoform X1 [Syngnathoides biaculeatus]XP_061672391.1 V-set and immunoglobulin domain-containing protein 10 isoform X1 [Syngnathoides biaculeatus]XP_061672392.1 V-set and immunoglobulin domain-containing protein 10 isoform X1 [Syngnathoides biaculeatus]
MMMMRRRRTLVAVYVFATVGLLWASEDVSVVATASPGDVVRLHCYSEGSVTPSSARWSKDGIEVGSTEATPPGGQRLEVLADGTLRFRTVAEGDEGVYLCQAALPANMTWKVRIRLQVASGPSNVSLSITPSTLLSNGTLVTYRGSGVSFRCAAASYPSQRLTWSFAGTPVASADGAPWLDFQMEDVRPEAQGVYTCAADNALTHDVADASAQLLVYYVPATHPECSWLRSEDSTQVRLGCAWAGCYPDPALRWTQERKRDPSADGDRDRDRDRDRGGRVLASGVTSVLWVALNRSLLADGQTLRCAAQHLALAGGREATCTFTLEAPRPEVSPLAWAQEGDNVTLTCTEATSVPPADTAWWREAGSAALAQGPKYALSREGAAHSLTIANVSRDDGGVYFCRSENPLALHRAEVYLSVRASSDYTGAVIGVFVAALIVGLAAVVAKLLFANRHRVCLGGPFGPSPGDGGDVLNLVESDEEQIFQAAPRLPPITALVQIHPLPTGEQEGVANENGREEAPDLVTL